MPSSNANVARLEGSERSHRHGATRVRAANPKDILHVILILQPRPDAPPLPDTKEWAKLPIRQRRAASHHESAADYGAASDDAEKVAAFATAHRLTVVEISLPRRLIELSGTVAQIDNAFGVNLGL